MVSAKPGRFAVLPSVDRVLKRPETDALVAEYGRGFVTDAVRAVLDDLRGALAGDPGYSLPEPPEPYVVERAADRARREMAPSLRPVFNLTGTVLHTNLGRAPLPPEAIDAVAAVARGASNLEFDLGNGRRGDRDAHLESWLCRLTGAEAATVVNNNAAAVLLTLNTLGLRRQVPVSRGELIEIGGAFRMPDIMARAGAKLVEVGTTNRTHLRDFAAAINERTGLLMTVHTSNYVVQGFTAAVDGSKLAALAHEHGLPLVEDLGSGTLVDLARYGLPHEPTPGEAIARGTDVVTFSGDKLLGGPQCGIVVGRADLVARIKKNPMKRALRCDKMTIAALAAVLRLYRDPDRLAERLPTIRQLARPGAEIEDLARRLAPAVAARLDGIAGVEAAPCMSQIGSGALPVESLPSAALVIRPAVPARRVGGALRRLATAFRGLPVPVIGRIEDDAFRLDLRCLEDESAFLDQLDRLAAG